MTGERRPRLALVAHDVHDDGGMERVVAELVRRLHVDFDIVVVSNTLAPDLRPLVTWERVRVPSAPFPLKFSCFFVRAGWRLRRLDVDLVQTVGAIVPNAVHVAAVHFCHADYRLATGALAPAEATATRRLNSTVARALALAAERWCYRPSRLAVLSAVSTGVARTTAQHYPGVEVVVVPNGVDTDRFRPDPGGATDLRGAGDGAGTVALFVGGDWDRKGLGMALQALAVLRDGDRFVRLWVVGDGDVGRYRAEAEALGVGDRVTFFGARSDTERFFQAADVFVLPSLYETFSLVAHEAAACGLPVVATAVHGVDDLVGAEEAGILVERRPGDVAAALARLVDDSGLRRDMGEEGRRRAALLTWDRCTGAARSLLEELLPRPSGHRLGDRRRTPPSVSVIVPTWRRPEALRDCLEGLARQHQAPLEVLVVRRAEDAAAAVVVAAARRPGLSEVVVERPGAVEALLAGSAVARGEVVAFVDDDAVPRPEWLGRLAAHYVDPRVGAVGGRDVVHVGGRVLDGASGRVGAITRWGRVLGGHHLGTGTAREVDHLKGVNMSVRRSLLTLPRSLRGAGAQVAWEVATCLTVSRSGARIVYEPAAIVDHHPAERFDGDRRDRRTSDAIDDAAYNESYVVMSLRPDLRRRRLLHQLVVGDRWSPGVARTVVAVGRREREVLQSVAPSLRGQLRAFRDSRSRPLVTTRPLDQVEAEAS